MLTLEEFSSKFNKGDKISGKIKSITDFGISSVWKAVLTVWFTCLTFHGMRLEKPQAVRFPRKAMIWIFHDPRSILSVSVSLGVKQLESDPFAEYTQLNDKGAIVRGTVRFQLKPNRPSLL